MPEDAAAAGVARVPLAVDGADAGGVRRGCRRSDVSGAEDPDVSTSPDGRLVDDAGVLGRHVREAVRFADGVAGLVAAGVTRFVEIGPDGVLAGAVAGDRPRTPVVRRRLCGATGHERTCDRRRPRPGCTWPGSTWTGRRSSPARRAAVELPTYAFQHQRYWLDHSAVAGDATALGLRTAPTTRCSAPPSRCRHATAWCSPAGCRCGRTPGWPTTTCSAASCCPAPRSSSWRSHAGARGRLRPGRGADARCPAACCPRRRRPATGAGRRPTTPAAARSRSTRALDDAGSWIRHADGVARRPARARRASTCRAWPPAGATAVDLERPLPALADARLRATARRSRACGPRGGAATTCSPRSRCPTAPPTDAASGCTRRCWTPRCTPSAFDAAARAVPGCRSVEHSRCTPPAPPRVRVRLTLDRRGRRRLAVADDRRRPGGADRLADRRGRSPPTSVGRRPATTAVRGRCGRWSARRSTGGRDAPDCRWLLPVTRRPATCRAPCTLRGAAPACWPAVQASDSAADRS